MAAALREAFIANDTDAANRLLESVDIDYLDLIEDESTMDWLLSSKVEVPIKFVNEFIAANLMHPKLDRLPLPFSDADAKYILDAQKADLTFNELVWFMSLFSFCDEPQYFAEYAVRTRNYEVLNVMRKEYPEQTRAACVAQNDWSNYDFCCEEDPHDDAFWVAALPNACPDLLEYLKKYEIYGDAECFVSKAPIFGLTERCNLFGYHCYSDLSGSALLAKLAIASNSQAN